MLEPTDGGGDRLRQFDLGTRTAENFVKHRFAGMSEGGVPKIVSHRGRFCEVLVESQRPRDGASQLPDLEGVGQPGAGMITDVRHENLGLVFEATKGARVQDPVAIALEGKPNVRWIVLQLSPSARLR